MRNDKRVQQNVVVYIGNPPPGGQTVIKHGTNGTHSVQSHPTADAALTGAGRAGNAAVRRWKIAHGGVPFEVVDYGNGKVELLRDNSMVATCRPTAEGFALTSSPGISAGEFAHLERLVVRGEHDVFGGHRVPGTTKSAEPKSSGKPAKKTTAKKTTAKKTAAKKTARKANKAAKTSKASQKAEKGVRYFVKVTAGGQLLDVFGPFSAKQAEKKAAELGAVGAEVVSAKGADVETLTQAAQATKARAKKPRKAAAKKTAAKKTAKKNPEGTATFKAGAHHVRVHYPEGVSQKRVQGVLNRHPPEKTKLATITKALKRIGASFVPWEGAEAKTMTAASGLYQQKGGKPASKKPASKKPASKKPASKKPASKKPASKKPASKKPASKKPASKKPASKKPASKKPASKKPASKKPASKKPPSEAQLAALAEGRAKRTGSTVKPAPRPPTAKRPAKAPRAKKPPKIPVPSKPHVPPSAPASGPRASQHSPDIGPRTTRSPGSLSDERFLHELRTTLQNDGLGEHYEPAKHVWLAGGKALVLAFMAERGITDPVAGFSQWIAENPAERDALLQKPIHAAA
jgi:cell division septation protein DedD